MAVMPTNHPSWNKAVPDAERKLNTTLAENSKGFLKGIVGEYINVSQWADSGSSGQVIHNAVLSDDENIRIDVGRKYAELGGTRLDAIAEAYRGLSLTRNLTRDEKQAYTEVTERGVNLRAALGKAVTNHSGDLDAAVYKDGRSVNDAFGFDDSAGGAKEIIQAFSDNPAYVAGALVGGILKDIPLLALAAYPLSRSSSRAAVASQTSKVINQVTRALPKSLQGLKYTRAAVKGTGATVIAAVSGAAEEAAYEYLDEGKVTADTARAGAEIGALLGLVGSGLHSVLTKTTTQEAVGVAAGEIGTSKKVSPTSGSSTTEAKVIETVSKEAASETVTLNKDVELTPASEMAAETKAAAEKLRSAMFDVNSPLHFSKQPWAKGITANQKKLLEEDAELFDAMAATVEGFITQRTKEKAAAEDTTPITQREVAEHFTPIMAKQLAEIKKRSISVADANAILAGKAEVAELSSKIEGTKLGTLNKNKDAPAVIWAMPTKEGLVNVNQILADSKLLPEINVVALRNDFNKGMLDIESPVLKTRIVESADPLGNYLNYRIEKAKVDKRNSLNKDASVPFIPQRKVESRIEQSLPRTKYWHGTDATFTTFNLNTDKKNRGSSVVDGVFVTPNKKEAEKFGKNVLELNIPLKNTFTRGESKVTQPMLDAYAEALRKESNYKSEWIETVVVPEFEASGRMKDDAISPASKRKVIMAGGYDSVADGDHIIVLNPEMISREGDDATRTTQEEYEEAGASNTASEKAPASDKGAEAPPTPPTGGAGVPPTGGKSTVGKGNEEVPNADVSSLLPKSRKEALLAIATAAGVYAYADEENKLLYAASIGGAILFGLPAGRSALGSVRLPEGISKAKAKVAALVAGIVRQNKANEQEVIRIARHLETGKIISAADQKTLVKARESTDGKYKAIKGDILKTDEQKELWASVEKYFEEKGKFISDNGLLKEDAPLLKNYIPHIIKGKNGKPLSPEEMEFALREGILGSKSTKAGTKREENQHGNTLYKTIEDLEKRGYDVVTDLSQIIQIYDGAIQRAILGRAIIDNISKMHINAMPDWYPEGGVETLKEFAKLKAAHPTLKIAPGLLDKKVFAEILEADGIDGGGISYSESSHPSLKGYMIHNNLLPLLEEYFRVGHLAKGYDVESILKLNAGLKRVFVFGSLFHAQALALSGVYTMGLAAVVRAARGRGEIAKGITIDGKDVTDKVDWNELEIGTEQMAILMKTAIEKGLLIGNTKNVALVNTGKAEIDELLAKGQSIAGVKQVAGGVKVVLDKIDEFTWATMHDRLKLAAFLRQEELNINAGMSTGKAGQNAATFVNDAFGSLDWDGFSAKFFKYAADNPNSHFGGIANALGGLTSTKNRKWMAGALFAPDWTTSNIRILGKGTIGSILARGKIYTDKIARGETFTKLTQAEKDIILFQKQYEAYAAKAFIYTSMLYATIMELFSDKGDATMEDLEDFWFGENSGKLNLSNQHSMVISKQVAEYIHMFQYFSHSALNKMAVVPKTMMEVMFNQQWFNTKKGRNIGPAITPEGEPSGMALHLAGKVVPIAFKPLLELAKNPDATVDDALLRVASGFVGFPRYSPIGRASYGVPSTRQLEREQAEREVEDKKTGRGMFQ